MNDTTTKTDTPENRNQSKSTSNLHTIFEPIQAVNFALACQDIIEGKNDPEFINRVIQRHQRVFHAGNILLKKNSDLQQRISELESEIEKMLVEIKLLKGNVSFLQG